MSSKTTWSNLDAAALRERADREFDQATTALAEMEAGRRELTPARLVACGLGGLYGLVLELRAIHADQGRL